MLRFKPVFKSSFLKLGLVFEKMQRKYYSAQSQHKIDVGKRHHGFRLLSPKQTTLNLQLEF
jgi:hypothetical protein